MVEFRLNIDIEKSHHILSNIHHYFKVTGYYSETPNIKQLYSIQFYSGSIILITSFELLTIIIQHNLFRQIYHMTSLLPKNVLQIVSPLQHPCLLIMIKENIKLVCGGQCL